MTIGERLFQRLMLIFMVIGFVALTVAAVMALRVVAQARNYTVWVNHTAEVERALFEERLALERMETARRGLLLSQNSRFLDVYREMRITVPSGLDLVGRLTRDNPVQQRATAQARSLLTRQLPLTDATVALILAGSRDIAHRRFIDDSSVPNMRALRALLQDMSLREAQLMVVRTAEQRRASRTLRYVLSGTAALLVAVAVLAVLVLTRYSRDLNRAAGDLRTLNETLEDQVAERTTDLKRANEEIQRFAYIVSHDLRSPLVNVMGFTAELETATGTLKAQIDRVEADAPVLLDKNAALAAREDLPEAIGFIRSSTERMDRLINAILRLSREGRRTLTPQRIDMPALIEGIAATLRHRLDDTGGEVGIEGGLPAIVNDRLAIEQIFSNLIENAVKYRSPARSLRVTVRGQREGGRAIFSIIDNGRGIDPRDHERVFDLFRRSGAQDQPGEGIGLAHVRALAYRLGGTISCESTLDAGATFRLSLPAEFRPEDQSA